MDLIGIPIITIILNFIGGCIRYITFNPINFLIDKKTYSFKDCLYGLKKTKGKIDKTDHFVANSIIGAVFFFIITTVIIKYNI